MSVTIDLTADKRVPFIDEDGATWVFFLEDWSDAAFAMHIRANPGDTGTPVVSLAGATSGTQGISCTYVTDYTFTDPETGEDVTGVASKVLCQIDEATLEAIALGTPADKAVELFYDLHVTPSGGVKRIGAEGRFTIRPGVTI